MIYHVKHVTSYRYSETIRESQMEVHMQPRSEGFQRCWSFRLQTSPRAELSIYHDPMNNVVHTFDIPGPHTRLVISAEAVVETNEIPKLPDALSSASWGELRILIDADDLVYELVQPSRFARPCALLEQFMSEHKIGRDVDPLTTL